MNHSDALAQVLAAASLSPEQSRFLRRAARNLDDAESSYRSALTDARAQLDASLADLNRDLGSAMTRLPTLRGEMALTRRFFWDAVETMLPEPSFNAIVAAVQAVAS